MPHSVIAPVLVVGALLALVACTAAAAPAAQRYVALGESYSSGTGTDAYDRSPSCERSRYAYPALVAQRRSNLKPALSFRDATAAFEGHGICGQSPRINGLASPITDSYHPSRTGHSRGYAPLVLRAID